MKTNPELSQGPAILNSDGCQLNNEKHLKVQSTDPTKSKLRFD